MDQLLDQLVVNQEQLKIIKKLMITNHEQLAIVNGLFLLALNHNHH